MEADEKDRKGKIQEYIPPRGEKNGQKPGGSLLRENGL
jgi:hypothetical protein